MSDVSTSYTFRPSTTAQKADLTSPPRRRVLSPSKTASLVRTPNHPCDHLKVANTLAKMDMRIWTTFQRFMYAAVASCTTSRGKTSYNGSVAHCQQRCQAAHGSISAKFKDDKLDRIVQVISDVGLSHLSPFSKKYLSRRFDISPAAFKDSVPEDDEKEASDIKSLVERTSKKKRELSLNEDAQFMRNATFENPRGANRVDCQIERLLRSREDALALACTNEELSPEEAMTIFFGEYIEFLEEAEVNLQIRQNEFDEFVALEIIILHPKTTPSDRYQEFIEEIRRFLALYASLCAKLPGTPNLKDPIRFFHAKSVYAPLEAFVENFDQAADEAEALDYYALTKTNLKSPEIIVDVEHIKADLKNRLIEVQTQLHKLREAKNDIPNLRKLYFGQMGSDKIRHTPTKDDIQRHFLDQLDEVVVQTSRGSCKRKSSLRLGDLSEEADSPSTQASFETWLAESPVFLQTAFGTPSTPSSSLSQALQKDKMVMMDSPDDFSLTFPKMESLDILYELSDTDAEASSTLSSQSPSQKSLPSPLGNPVEILDVNTAS